MIDLDLDRLTVPYAGQTRMRLTIGSGMSGASIRVDPGASALITIHGDEELPPRLRVSESELHLSWPSTIEGWLESLFTGGRDDIEIVLHPAVTWALQIRGGLSRFEADLAAGKLERLEIRGGVSDTRLDLPTPDGVVPIRISGGASSLALRRPADAGFALDVRGGVSELQLDDQYFGAIGGGARLMAARADGGGQYALEISGGVSALQVFPRAP